MMMYVFSFLSKFTEFRTDYIVSLFTVLITANAAHSERPEPVIIHSDVQEM